jgi:hypothetical protein
MTPRGLILSIGLLGTFGSALVASPIFVSNFSFENLPPGAIMHSCAGTGCQYTLASENAIPGWTASVPASEGQFNPGSTTTYFNSIPNGNWVGFADAGNLTQTVATVAANTIYTLNVSVGLRKDASILGTAELLINGTPYVAAGASPTSGNFSTFTAVYNSSSHPGDVGMPIVIELISHGFQGDFDNVLLDGTSGVPEPTTVAFVMTGLTGLAFAARARRRQRS